MRVKPVRKGVRVTLGRAKLSKTMPKQGEAETIKKRFQDHPGQGEAF